MSKKLKSKNPPAPAAMLSSPVPIPKEESIDIQLDVYPPSPRTILRRKTGDMDKILNIANLPTAQYQELLNGVESQIQKTIAQSITLQKRKEIIEKLIISESIFFLILNSTASLVGTTNGDGPQNVALYLIFSIGLIASSMSLTLKWVKNRQEKDIENYRTSIKEIVNKYGADAWYLLEQQRMQLPSEVLASGFFRGLEDHNIEKVDK